MYFRLRYKNRGECRHPKWRRGNFCASRCFPYPMTFGGEDSTDLLYFRSLYASRFPKQRGHARAFYHSLSPGCFAMEVHFSTLIPAEPWLFDYYARMGYASVFKYSTKEIVLPEIFLSPSKDINIEIIVEFQEEVYSYLNKKLSERACCIQHTSEDFQVIMTDLCHQQRSYLFLARQEKRNQKE